MIKVQDIIDLIEPKLEGTDQFVVNVEVKPGNRIIVELDADSGLAISDCVAVSRHIEHSLDRESEDFELKVSSAGLDQPLRKKRQYQKNIGRKLKIKTLDGSEKQGVLKEITDDALMLEIKSRQKQEGKKGKKTIIESESIPFDGISESKLVITI